MGFQQELYQAERTSVGAEKKKTRRRSGWFSRTADKEKDNYRGSKNLFSAFFWELFLLHLSLSLTESLCTPLA